MAIFQKIITFGPKIVDLQSVIQLEPPTELQGDSFWVKIKSLSGSVEGKLHLSKADKSNLIIFEPGFPGDASTRLERLWLDELLRKGFDVLAIRHNGTVINGKYSDIYLNCKERQLRAKEQGQEVLGDKPQYTIGDWLDEPLIALESLFKSYKEIYLIGHSFGGLAILYSLVNFCEKYSSEAKRVKRLISLAGTTGMIRGDDDPVLNRWREYIDTDVARARIKIGEAEQNIKSLKRAYDLVHRKIALSTKYTQMIFVYVYGNGKSTLDEFIYPNEPLDILSSLNGNGILVIDRSEKSDEATGRLAHDMDNLKSSILVKLLQERLEKQFFVI